MTSIACSPTPFAYSTHRVPDEQMLVRWRQLRDAQRRAPASFRLPRLRPGW
jgi:hypothetical protein